MIYTIILYFSFRKDSISNGDDNGQKYDRKLHEARQLQLVQVAKGFLFCGLEGKILFCLITVLEVSARSGCCCTSAVSQ